MEIIPKNRNNSEIFPICRQKCSWHWSSASDYCWQSLQRYSRGTIKWESVVLTVLSLLWTPTCLWEEKEVWDSWFQQLRYTLHW